MNIRIKKNIAIDAFISTSGRYRVFLAEAYRPDNRFGAGFATLRWFEAVFMRSDGARFKKELGGGLKSAMEEWERIKAELTAPFKGEEEQPDEWVAYRYDSRNFTEEEVMALKINPIGARVFVREIQVIDEVTKRAEEAGLAVVIAEASKPKPTMGIVLKVGNDPLMSELCEPGWIVMFSKHAGSTFMEHGQMYRNIELHEIIGVRSPSEGFDDLGLKDNPEVLQDMMDLAVYPKETGQ